MTLYTLLTQKQPEVFSPFWIKHHERSVYKYLCNNIRNETGTLDWDSVTINLDQIEATFEHGKKKLKWYTKEFNEPLFAQPYIKPKRVGELLDKTSRTTITGYMSELVSLEILTPKQDGKEVFYLNNDLIRILEV